MSSLDVKRWSENEKVFHDGGIAPMSFKASTPSRERRIKRICVRLGLHLMTAQKPDKQVLAHGGYMLRDARTMTIVLGDKGYLFSADLDDVEAYLDALS